MALFSKRHYEFLAKRNKELLESAATFSQLVSYRGSVFQLAAALRDDNSAFDEKRFLEACGIKE